MLADTREFPAYVATERSTDGTRRSTLARLALLGAGAAVLALAYPRSADSARAAAASRSASSATGPATIASLDRRPSHARRYLAEVTSAPVPRPGTPQRWIVRIAAPDGRPISDARIAVRVWMPETGERSSARVAMRGVGPGLYRMDGIAFPRAGWWNVALAIDGPAARDSVAFNLILPSSR